MGDRFCPVARHTGSAGITSDLQRSAWSSKHMPIRCVTHFVKGDWCQCAATLGLPMWTDKLRPCYRCNVSHVDLGGPASVAVHYAPFREYARTDYELACQECVFFCRVSGRDVESRRACIMTGAMAKEAASLSPRAPSMRPA